MVVDFAELRNRILAGEDDVEEDALPTPFRAELREDNMTLFSILLGGSLLGVSMLDRAKHDGAIFTTTNGSNYGPLADALGFGSFLFGMGRLSRGLQAQEEIENYEKLVTEAEGYVATMSAEMEEMAAEAEEKEEEEKAKKEKPQQLDLIGSNWNTHIPAGGFADFGTVGNMHGSAVGQQPVFYRRGSNSSPFSY